MDDESIEKFMEELDANSDNMEIDENEKSEDLKVKLILAEIELRKYKQKVVDLSNEIAEINAKIESSARTSSTTVSYTHLTLPTKA